VLGNGSDELIQMLAMALAAPGRVVLAPEPSFTMYRLIASCCGLDYVGVPLRAQDFALDLEATLAAISRHRPALVFLAYPNNPTGNRFPPAAVEAIVRATPGLVVIDEAYSAFAEHSFLARACDFDNLVVMRTLSKVGLAGLRLGFLAGRAEWLDELEKVRLPYNINVLTQASVRFALAHRGLLEAQTARIRADRASLHAALEALPGLVVYPSEANFLLLRTPPGRADALFAALRRQGVLIRNLSTGGGLLADCLRVTIGTPAENETFLSALAGALAQPD